MKIKVVLLAFFFLIVSLETISAKDWQWTPESGQWISEKDIEKRSARLQYEKAKEKEDIGDVKGAIKEYSRLVKLYPASVYAPDAQYMVGILWEGEGDYYKAYKEYAKVVDNYPSYKKFLEIIEREYRIANVYLAGEKMKVAGIAMLPARDKAIEIYEHIVRSAPFSSFAPRAQFNVGEAYRIIKRYSEAIPEYQKLLNNYPESNLIVEAAYHIGMCGFLKSQAAPYDQSATDIAIGAMRDFLKKFPKSRRASEIRAKLNILLERKASKSFEIALFYEKDKSDEAAIIYYQDVINEYPGTDLALKAEKRIDELIAKPTSKKYEEKGKGGNIFGGLANIKIPMPKMPKLFAKKEPAEQKEVPQEAPRKAADKETKKFWEIWKKGEKKEPQQKEVVKKEEPKKVARAEDKKNFWEFWKKEPAKGEAAKTEEKLGEEGTLKMSEVPEGKPTAAEESKPVTEEYKLPSETAPAEGAEKVTAKREEGEPTDEEVEKELMGEGEKKEAADAVEPSKEPEADKVETAAEEEIGADAGVEEKISQVAAEIPKELDVVQVTDLKLVETDKGSKLVFVTNKPVSYSSYELKDPSRLMLSMKTPVFSKLEDKIMIGKAGLKSVRNHYRNKDEGDLGCQLNAVVIDFDKNVGYEVTSTDSSIIVELK